MFLIRDLVSPRTWLAFTNHLAGWVVAVVFFLIVGFGIAIGLGSLPLALVGLPVLGLTLRCADWLAAEERARFAVLLGVQSQWIDVVVAAVLLAAAVIDVLSRRGATGQA